MDQMRQTANAGLGKARTLASIIPPTARLWIYSILATLVLLEMIWDIIPNLIEGKVLASLSVLGFGMAALNTGDTEQ